MLSKIWNQQKRYNEKIFSIEKTKDKEYWSRQYLLGITSQIGEVLDEIHWKRNRKEENKKAIPLNVLDEIADITKFTLSLAQVWGFSQDELLNAIFEKGEILDFRLQMEFKESLENKTILITDIDGTLADYRYSFLMWLYDLKGITPSSEAKTLLLDDSLELRYPLYYALKQEFEENGGYRNLKIYPEVHDLLNSFAASGGYIIAVTARPVRTYKRIFKDTLHWFKINNLPINELHTMNEERILLADSLSRNNKVILWEDNPDMLQRASKSDIKIFARKQLYNKDLANIKNIEIVDEYNENTLA